MKTCNTCFLSLPLDDFYCHPKAADGRLGRCKSCHKGGMNALRRDNPEVYRERDRLRSDLPHRVAARRAYDKTIDPDQKKQYIEDYKRAYPERRAAHIAVGNAVRDGRLIKRSCEVCDSSNTHAHHDDYSKPLDVRWLCAKCHGARHRALNENQRGTAKDAA